MEIVLRHTSPWFGSEAFSSINRHAASFLRYLSLLRRGRRGRRRCQSANWPVSLARRVFRLVWSRQPAKYEKECEQRSHNETKSCHRQHQWPAVLRWDILKHDARQQDSQRNQRPASDRGEDDRASSPAMTIRGGRSIATEIRNTPREPHTATDPGTDQCRLRKRRPGRKSHRTAQRAPPIAAMLATSAVIRRRVERRTATIAPAIAIGAHNHIAPPSQSAPIPTMADIPTVRSAIGRM